MRVGVILVSTLVLLTGSAAAANPKAPPAGSPSVLCKRKTFPGRLNPTDPGLYFYRPPHCTLEAPKSRLPETKRFQPIYGIKWFRWEAGLAEGHAKIPIRTLHIGIHGEAEKGWGLTPITITLDRPVLKCAHLVFSHAEISHFVVTASYSLRLDSVPVLGRGCP